MRLTLLFCLILCAFAPRCPQETNSYDSICCTRNDSEYRIENNSEKIVVYFNAKYTDIDSYLKENIQISDSPAHKTRTKDIVDRFLTAYKVQIKSIADSYGINVKNGIFIINPAGKLEVVSFTIERNDNTLSRRQIRSMFDQLYDNMEFSPWDDEVRECLTVRFE